MPTSLRVSPTALPLAHFFAKFFRRHTIFCTTHCGYRKGLEFEITPDVAVKEATKAVSIIA